MSDHFFPLGFFPTPVQPLRRIGLSYPDYQLFIKRDDLTGLALGGNKTRKLEYLIQEARSLQSDAVITSGAAQSNHCRQTAAACAIAGLPCYLILADKGQSRENGNLLLDRLLGARLYWREEGYTPESLAARLIEDGARPYIIPVGGSNETGSLGYWRAMSELAEQQKQMKVIFDYIVTATSSGGTQAGMLLGKYSFGIHAEIIGINIDKTPIFEKPAREHIRTIMQGAASKFNLTGVDTSEAIHLITDYDQPGYGVLTDREKQAIERMARSEGILLDPVYTGRAFAGLMDLLEKKFFKKGSNILFWHTGGAAALFAYADELRSK